MSEATETHSLPQHEIPPSLLPYLNVADRLLLMGAATISANVRQQLEEIAETYAKLASLCASFKNLQPKIAITGPILPDQ